MCGSCAVAESDEWIRLAQLPPKPPDPPKPRVCRVVGCGEPLSERSAMTTAPRWRDLCEGHYNVQRARQSELAYCRTKAS